MRLDRILAAAFAAFLVSAANASAYFVIELRDGRRLEANFVRSDGEKVFVSRASGEIEIGRAQVLSIQEVEPGRLLGEAAGGEKGTEPPAVAEARPLSVEEIRERDREVTREIILLHRDQLFARLRGDDPSALDERRGEIEALEKRRAGLRGQLPSWEQSR